MNLEDECFIIFYKFYADILIQVASYPRVSGYVSIPAHITGTVHSGINEWLFAMK